MSVKNGSKSVIGQVFLPPPPYSGIDSTGRPATTAGNVSLVPMPNGDIMVLMWAYSRSPQSFMLYSIGVRNWGGTPGQGLVDPSQVPGFASLGSMRSFASSQSSIYSFMPATASGLVFHLACSEPDAGFADAGNAAVVDGAVVKADDAGLDAAVLADAAVPGVSGGCGCGPDGGTTLPATLSLALGLLLAGRWAGRGRDAPGA